VSVPAEPRSSGNPRTDVFDVRAEIDAGGWSRLAKATLALTALAVVLDGFDIQVIGFSIGPMAKDFGSTKEALSWVVALGYIGIGLGAGAGGYVGDRIGRKNTMLIAVATFAVFTLLTAFAPNLVLIGLFRTLAGLGLGMVFPVVAALVAELTPLRRRGFAVALALVCLPAGAMLGGVVAAAVLPSMGWRFLFVLGGVAPLLLGVAMRFVLPESPQFQAARGTERDITGALTTLRRMGHDVGPTTVFAKRNEVERASFAALLSPDHRRDTIGLWIAFFFSLMGVYAFLSWGPTLLTAAGFSVAVSSLGVSVFHSGGILFAIAGGWLLVRYGSRVVLTTYALGTAVVGAWLFAVQPAAESPLPLVFAQLFLYGGCLSGLQVVLFSLAAHAYPVTIRATGVGAAGSIGRFGAILAAFVGVVLVSAGGGWFYVLVITVGVLAAVALTMIRRHTPATAARSTLLEPAAVPR